MHNILYQVPIHKEWKKFPACSMSVDNYQFMHGNIIDLIARRKKHVQMLSNNQIWSELGVFICGQI